MNSIDGLSHAIVNVECVDDSADISRAETVRLSCKSHTFMQVTHTHTHVHACTYKFELSQLSCLGSLVDYSIQLEWKMPCTGDFKPKLCTCNFLLKLLLHVGIVLFCCVRKYHHKNIEFVVFCFSSTPTEAPPTSSPTNHHKKGDNGDHGGDSGGGGSSHSSSSSTVVVLLVTGVVLVMVAILLGFNLSSIYKKERGIYMCMYTMSDAVACTQCVFIIAVYISLAQQLWTVCTYIVYVRIFVCVLVA